MPPGGGDLPIFLGANSADPIPDYTVLWSNTDPPGSGTLFTAHYNPGAADPFTYEGSPGDGLTITQSEHTTSGGVHITVFTLNAMGLSHRDLGRSTRAGNSGRSYF
jgi:hypothetical protein